MRVDCHMHTPFCGHAVGEPEEYVGVAADQGIELVTFTCHIPMDDEGFGGPRIRMYRDDLPMYREAVGRARKAGESLGVEVLCGIEAEVFPDAAVMNRMDEILADNTFDFILGSLHHPLERYRNWLRDNGLLGDDKRVIEAYFAHLTVAAMSGRYNSLSHPDVIRLYGTLVEPFDPTAHEEAIRRFLQTVAECDMCMEVNTSGLIKGDYVIHPDPVILGWAAEAGVKLTIGSDAHRPEQVGQHFDYAETLLREKGFDRYHYFREGQRQEVLFDAQIGKELS